MLDCFVGFSAIATSVDCCQSSLCMIMFLTAVVNETGVNSVSVLSTYPVVASGHVGIYALIHEIAFVLAFAFVFLLHAYLCCC